MQEGTKARGHASGQQWQRPVSAGVRKRPPPVVSAGIDPLLVRTYGLRSRGADGSVPEGFPPSRPASPAQRTRPEVWAFCCYPSACLSIQGATVHAQASLLLEFTLERLLQMTPGLPL